jgi:microcystin-dependent protein
MKTLVYFLIFLASAVGTYNIIPEPTFSAALPQTVAVFETSLQAPLTSSATSMTLTANAIRGGGALSGFNCFTVDEGAAAAETICGTVSGTSVTSLTRGVSPVTGTSTVSALQFAHRRGANVKITDSPILNILKAQNNGEDTFPNLLTYTSGTNCSVGSSNQTLCDKAYVDGVAVAGASNANETTKGIVELSTAAEAGAGTSLGSTAARLALPGSLATSTPTAAGCSAFCVVVAAAGKIAQAFIDLTASFIWTGQHTFNGTQGVSTTTVNNGLAIATTTQLGVYGGISPVGSITAYASTTAPAGWLLADGSSVLRSQYPQLFAVIGTSYGAADGTHFTLPDLKGRNILMASSSPAVGQTGGERNHTLIVSELAAHTHGITVGASDVAGPDKIDSSSDTSGTAQTGSTGGDVAHNVLDPFIALQYIIKY